MSRSVRGLLTGTESGTISSHGPAVPKLAKKKSPWDGPFGHPTQANESAQESGNDGLSL